MSNTSKIIFKSSSPTAWYLQIKDLIIESKRPIDKMSIADVNKMYERKQFVCDSCGTDLGKCNFTLEEHITHLINPMILWSCDACIENDFRNGRIIATEREKIGNWEIQDV